MLAGMTLADDKKSKVLARGANSDDDVVAVGDDAVTAALRAGTLFVLEVVPSVAVAGAVVAAVVAVAVVDDSRRPDENSRSVADDKASANRPVSLPWRALPLLPLVPLLLL